MINDSDEKYIPALDGLRFVAFFLVFIHHGIRVLRVPFIARFQEWGWIGVDLFFVLSSFLITRLLIFEFKQTRTIDFKKFWIRRTFRIWPLYYLAIFLALIVFPVFFEPKLNNPLFSSVIKDHFLGLIFFYSNFIASVKGYVPDDFLNILWTVSVEEHFYLIWPILMFYLLRLRPNYTAALISITVLSINVARYLVLKKTHSFMSVHPNSLLRFDAFIIGGAVAIFEDKLIKISWQWFAFFFVGFLILFFSFDNITANTIDTSWQYTLIALSFSSLIMLTLKLQWLRSFLSQRYLVYLGKISFGLYIFHRLGLVLAQNLSDKLHFHSPTFYMVAICFTIVAASISYYLFESQFLRLKERYAVIASRPI